MYFIPLYPLVRLISFMYTTLSANCLFGYVPCPQGQDHHRQIVNPKSRNFFRDPMITSGIRNREVIGTFAKEQEQGMQDCKRKRGKWKLSEATNPTCSGNCIKLQQLPGLEIAVCLVMCKEARTRQSKCIMKHRKKIVQRHIGRVKKNWVQGNFTSLLNSKKQLRRLRRTSVRSARGRKKRMPGKSEIART